MTGAPMDDQNKNLILATALSFLVILVWFVLFPPPEVTPAASPAAVTQPAPAPGTGSAAPGATAETAPAPSARAPRVEVESEHLTGSISLLGGRIDRLSLKSYRQTLQPGSDIVHLLVPAGEAGAFYAVHGWTAAQGIAAGDVPGPNTMWTAPGGARLTTGQPLVLTWDNGKGQVFTREIALDADYMFTVTDRVANGGAAPVSLQPWGILARHGQPKTQNIWVVHEGYIARTDGTFTETDYSEAVKLPEVPREGALAEVTEATTDGWIGFTDHYWMATLVPEQGKPWTAVTKYVPQADTYQAEMRAPVATVAPGGEAVSTTRLFAGAKEWETIRGYQNEAGVAGFVDAIDWGWFYFLTKPIFAVLHWLNQVIGNMGWAIIGLTFVLKLLVLPLAYKSYVSMARMKELQPEMEAIKERAGEDKQKLQKEMMQLYKDKKVNPAAGCLPILIQIPIFFSLYKVIFVTIELRHAPFFGWLNDLSAPDTSSLFNLFGLLPWDAPVHPSLLATIFIGVLPILLGITMWLQQKLNPQPTDPTQAAVFAWMPWIFMFMLGSFASGLVVYWITNNIITFVQQYAIMRSHGHTPDIFGNIRSSFARKAATAPTPANRPGPPKKGGK
jgi:YidC/Oxa1 family membrane protein insertase